MAVERRGRARSVGRKRRMRRKRPSSWPVRGRRREHVTRAKAAPGAGTFLAPVGVSVFRHPDGRRVRISPYNVRAALPYSAAARHHVGHRVVQEGQCPQRRAQRQPGFPRFSVRPGTTVDNPGLRQWITDADGGRPRPPVARIQPSEPPRLPARAGRPMPRRTTSMTSTVRASASPLLTAEVAQSCT